MDSEHQNPNSTSSETSQSGYQTGDQSKLLEFSDFPHLTIHEWSALKRMAKVLGDSVVVNLLTTLSPEEQRSAAVGYMSQEIELGGGKNPTSSETSRKETLKLSVSKFSGDSNEPLLRWLVEVEAAMTAQQLQIPGNQVAFAMSHLSGRAKSWAFGRRMADPTCFSTYQSFRDDLRAAFEPPKSEFRARTEFLALRQNSGDLQLYAQKARYLVASVVEHPIDMVTQVTTFLMGLDDGPVKTQLFREYPETLEHAIARAMEEDFSLKSSRYHPGRGSGRASRPSSSSKNDGPEPMDLSALVPDKSHQRCNRCNRAGHFAYECRAPAPVPRTERGRGNGRFTGRGRGRGSGRPKNYRDQ